MEAKEWAAERLELKSMLLKRDKEVEEACAECRVWCGGCRA